MLAAIPMVEHDADYERLLAELELKQQASDTPEIQALRSEEPVDSRRHIHMSEGENHGPIRHIIHTSPPTNSHTYVTNPHGDLVITSRELE